MSNSIEIRMPFLDNDVRLFSLSLQTNHKIRNSRSKSILRDSFKNYLPKSIYKQEFKQGLSQHKFDFKKQKYNFFIKEIINQKNFVTNKMWDGKKIIKDFDSGLNQDIIWRICKHHLMIEGFKDCYIAPIKDKYLSSKYNDLSLSN